MEQYNDYDALLEHAAENSPDYEEEEVNEEKPSNPSAWTIAAFMRTRLAF